jgi:hypothetical protein
LAIRYPLQAIRYPLQAIRYPLQASGLLALGFYAKISPCSLWLLL